MIDLFCEERNHIIPPKEAELNSISTCKDFLQVRKEGNREVQRKTSFYNLDVIISVGYRVKSKQGTQFRIWATKVLKNHLLKGYTINKRMDRLENNMENLKEKVNEIDLQINSHLIPTQGVNAQYGGFEAKQFTQSHDRFFIIDDKDVFHLGASLKDLGKKWFAFSKMDKSSIAGIIKAVSKVV